MLNKINDLDEKSLALTEKVCHLIQLIFGVNNFFVAKLLILFSVIAGLQGNWGIFISSFFAIVEISSRFVLVVFGESTTKVSEGSVFANTLRNTYLVTVFRYYHFITFVYCIFTRNKDRWLEQLMCWIFFMVVVITPLPPIQSKIKIFLNSLGRVKIQPATS